MWSNEWAITDQTAKIVVRGGGVHGGRPGPRILAQVADHSPQDPSSASGLGERLSATSCDGLSWLRGKRCRARHSWQQALRILEVLQRPDADELRAKLGSDHDTTLLS